MNRFYLNLNLLTALENQLKGNKNKINVKYSTQKVVINILECMSCNN